MALAALVYSYMISLVAMQNDLFQAGFQAFVLSWSNT